MIALIDEPIYLGSCQQPEYGMGNLIRGKSVRKDEKTGQLFLTCLDGEEIRVFSAVRLVPGPNQSSPTNIMWLEGLS